MKNIKIMKALTVFAAALVFQVFAATGAQAAACSALTGSNVPAVVDGERGCTLTPTSLIFKIYELSLCTKAVTPTTSASEKAARCETLFESTAGKDVDLTPGASFSMDDGFSIEEGTYTHGLLKVNTTFSMTTAHQFTASYTADDATGGADTSGAFCFSNGRGIDAYVPAATHASQITCHASAFSALPNSITQKMFGRGDTSDVGTNHQMNTEIRTPNAVGGVTAYTDLYILKADSSLATGDVTRAGVGAGRAATLDGTHDRKYILADQTLSSPVVINADTKGLGVQFNVTNSASLEWNGASPTNLIGQNAFNGMLFIFSAN